MSVVSAPTTYLPAIINYELLDSVNSVASSWLESVTLTDNLGHTSFLITEPYSFPFSATQTLPLETYTMQISDQVDPARADLIPGGTIPIETNTANNVNQSLGAESDR